MIPFNVVPVFAIVGRPNVGKSTFFNALTKTKQALVLDEPGVTRDRIYGEGWYQDQKFIVVDTGGLTTTESSLSASMRAQTEQAIEESNCVFFMVDGRAGLQPEDYNIAKRLRLSKRPVFVVVNKTEGQPSEIAIAEFYALGLGKPIAISASHQSGIHDLLEFALENIGKTEEAGTEDRGSKTKNRAATEESDFQDATEESELETETEESKNTEAAEDSDETDTKQLDIPLAIVGRPNVGKSTLVNRILGEHRVLVLDEPGTTRDSIYIPFEKADQIYTLIDTAGVRKRGKVTLKIEKFSVIKTLQAIEASEVVILVIDAKEGLTDQDLSLLEFILDAGKGIVIAINKWDGLTDNQKKKIKASLSYRLKFVNFAEIYYISALHGTGVGHLLDAVKKVHHSATKTLSTAIISRVLAKAQADHAPPLIRGRRIKLRYAHAGGKSPPLIVIHGNQTEFVPDTYKRYLMNCFRQAFKIVGTPIRLEFKTTKNPYAKKTRDTKKTRASRGQERQQHRRRKPKKL